MNFNDLIKAALVSGLGVLFSVCVSTSALSLERLSIDTVSTNNVKRVTFSATIEDGVHVNGLCFISTGVAEKKSNKLFGGGLLSSIGNLIPGFKEVGKIAKGVFKQFDSYCGMSAGRQRRGDGSIRKKLKKNYKASLFLDVYEHDKRLALLTDAFSCSQIRKVKHCFKSYDAESEYSGLKSLNGTNIIEVKKGVNGIAGCFQLTEISTDKRTSIVVTLGSVPSAISGQKTEELKPGEQPSPGQAEIFSKSCYDLGFNVD